MQEMSRIQSNNDGEDFCLACGEEASGCEPDARQYECELCGARKVYGIEELLMMGLIQLVPGRLPMLLNEQVQKLRSVIGLLSQKRLLVRERPHREIMKRAANSVRNKPHWIDVLIERAESPKPAVQKLNVGGFAGVIELFLKAKAKLKWPKIVLSCQGEKVVLSMAGPNSKSAGSINVSGEGSYPNRVWFGRVDPSGAWEPSRSIQPEMLAALRKLLSELASDPAGVARKHGSLTGHCCFCNLVLTDERSTAAGFGPTCAKNYGLEAQWREAVRVEREAA